MKKKIMRAGCVLLSVFMLLAGVACGKKKNTVSEVEETQYEYVNGTSEGSNAAGQGGSASTASSNKKSNSKTSGSTAAPSVINDNVKPADYKGTTVKYATWIDPDTAEDGPVVSDFESKYGIKVDVVLCGQGSYINKINGLIASGQSPDVYFCNADFPSCMPSLQPISAAKLNLKEKIWDSGMVSLSTFNGKTYLVNTVGNIWNEVDCCFYNKKLLKENNITTPEEYQKAGKWTYDALAKVMTEVKGLGKDYIGGYIDYKCFIGSTGSAFLKLGNGKLINGTNSILTDAYRYLATWTKNGLIKGTTENYRDDFLTGKCGIAITNAYGLKKNGYWKTMNPDHIGFTYIPDMDESHKAVTTGMFRGWGIIKGAKNPVAAGIFLRYYLDVNNYNSSSAFINSSAESFFYKLTSGVNTDQKNPYFYVGMWGCGGHDYSYYTTPSTVDPAQVSQTISSMQNEINSDVSKANTFINQNTK